MVTRRTILAASGSVLGVPVGAQSDIVPEPDPGGPVIVDVTQSDPSIPADGLTVTARARDPNGELARVAVGDGENYVRLDDVPVSGRTATATLEFENAPYHVRHGYATLVWAVSTDGRTGPVTRLEPPVVSVPVRAQFVSVNDPVPAGAYLEATISVENIGNPMDVGPLPDLHLIAGEVVDTTSIDVPVGEVRSVRMGYETYPVQTDVEFTLELVAGETLADTRLVRVRA